MLLSPLHSKNIFVSCLKKKQNKATKGVSIRDNIKHLFRQVSSDHSLKTYCEGLLWNWKTLNRAMAKWSRSPDPRLFCCKDPTLNPPAGRREGKSFSPRHWWPRKRAETLKRTRLKLKKAALLQPLAIKYLTLCYFSINVLL